MTQLRSRRLLLLILGVAFPLSFVWEMLQMFAYAPFNLLLKHGYSVD